MAQDYTWPWPCSKVFHLKFWPKQQHDTSTWRRGYSCGATTRRSLAQIYCTWTANIWGDVPRQRWNCALQAAHQLQVIKEVPLWELNMPMGNPGQLKRNSSKNRRCPSHVWSLDEHPKDGLFKGHKRQENNINQPSFINLMPIWLLVS